MSGVDTCFAVAAPGLEAVVAEEAREIGLPGVAAEPGGVAFTGGLVAGMRACLWLRTATTVRLRLARFPAPDEKALRRGLGALRLAAFLPQGPVAVRATSRRSRMKHTGRLAEALAALVPGPVEAGSGGLLLRVEGDVAEVSLDLAGDRLHQRGWRKEGGPAPLRETLASGLLRLLDWDPETPLVDPMCGSGTLPIEAALRATRTAPGLLRSFAFEALPSFEHHAWRGMRIEAEAAREAAPAPLVGGDRHGGAVGSAQRNAARAGVAEALHFERRDLAEARPPPGPPGLLVTNPPYGARIEAGGGGDLLGLYRTLGRLLEGPFAGWTLGFLTSRSDLARAVAPDVEEVARLRNGGLPVRLYRVPARR